MNSENRKSTTLQNQQLTLLSPAKLNLMLHITGRKADGYHQLQTLFQLLDYGDTLHIQTRPDRKITLRPSIPNVADHDNLIIRAAKALQSYTGHPIGADIRLEKILPMGGGIGGGSSNAATTLLGLNRLWKTALTIDEMADLGLQLGADVPVFIRGQSAWAEGIGEQLEAVAIPEYWYCVIKPPCEVSTAQIFSHKQLTRDTSPITIAAVFEQGGHNDCEAVVRKLYPEVDIAFNWLNDRLSENSSSDLTTSSRQDFYTDYNHARLTGTGACIFAAFTDYKSAEQILNKLPEQLQGFIAKGVNTSPTHKALNL